jgi:Helicase conserved C-terminal domain
MASPIGVVIVHLCTPVRSLKRPPLLLLLQKYHSLIRILRENWSPKDRVLVFVETKKGCDMLTRSLRVDGFQARAMHGDKSQEERDNVLRDFKGMRVSLLVATDGGFFSRSPLRVQLPASGFSHTISFLFLSTFQLLPEGWMWTTFASW